MKVENRNEITVEPYDDRFDIKAVERTLNRRRKAILRALNSEHVDVTMYDEWRMYGAYILTIGGLARIV